MYYQKKDLINIKDIDGNKCLKWCLLRYIHPKNLNTVRIREIDKEFSKNLDFHPIQNGGGGGEGKTP